MQSQHRLTDLERAFSLIAFDWDGTAVVDRSEETAPLRESLDELLERGTLLAIITGTNFGNIDRQCTGAIEGRGRGGLYILTNRGSEVYRYNPPGEPELLWRRVATPTEESLLTAAADRVQEILHDRTGLEFSVIYDRLNRRKVDLIPTDEWSDPPKSRLADLVAAVEARLRGAGLRGGLREAFSIAEESADTVGLTDAQITSDVKHIEIGLTDKADSIRWLLHEVARPEGIEPTRIMIVGDEFGPIAGFDGSDAKLVIPEAVGATYISVGPEPAGVPPGVLHLGGGPPRFRELLATQIAHRRGSTGLPVGRSKEPTQIIIEEGFNLAREHEIEALFTISNGYLGSRGSLSEGSSLSAPATYIAGVFANPSTPRAVPGLAIGPDWMQLAAHLDGQPLRLEDGGWLSHRRILDLRQGILWREWRHEGPAGQIMEINTLRLASHADRHLLIQLVSLVTDGNGGHLQLTTQTGSSFESGSGVRVAFAARTRVRGPTGSPLRSTLERRPGEILEHWEGEVEPDTVYRLDRIVAVCTTREALDPESCVIDHLQGAEARGIDRLLDEHIEAWSDRWWYSAIRCVGDDFAQRALNFATYHLIGAADPGDERVSIGARALTGDAYKGHVFWDTEIFMLPFYTLTDPASARSLLSYRYHTLAAAREKARLFGYRGALFAWESGIDGLEATPSVAVGPDGRIIRIRSSEEEHHISADIAYAVWQYWQFTGDDDFLLDYGAEIILETARFWASRGQIEGDGRYHIRHIIGPDEYHEGVDDNAFTNVMAQWNMERGAEVARLLRDLWPDRWQSLSDSIDLEPGEPESWTRLAAETYTGFDPETGLFEQFAGYFDLEPIDITEYEPRTAPLDLILGREGTQRSQVIKQADVVLLIYLLWDRFPPAVRAANFRYYEPRCGHGSSLSPGIHGLIAARLGDLDLAERYFQQTAEIDLANNMGNAAGGVHIGALGSLWQLAIFGAGGLYPGLSGRLTIDPKPLPRWRELEYRVRWRGRTLNVQIDSARDRIVLSLEEGRPLEVMLRGQPLALRSDGPPTTVRFHG